MAAFTQSQYDELCAAIAQGAKLVKYADKEVQYNSLAEMLQLKDIMEKDLQIKPAATILRDSPYYDSGL